MEPAHPNGADEEAIAPASRHESGQSTPECRASCTTTSGSTSARPGCTSPNLCYGRARTDSCHGSASSKCRRDADARSPDDTSRQDATSTAPCTTMGACGHASPTSTTSTAPCTCRARGAARPATTAVSSPWAPQPQWGQGKGRGKGRSEGKGKGEGKSEGKARARARAKGRAK